MDYHARVATVAISLVSFFASDLCAQTVLRVRAAAAGGFSGFKVAEVLRTPAFTCRTPNACIPVSDSFDLVRNTFYRWTPALSAGVDFTISGQAEEAFGGGLGVHTVFVSEGGGTRPLPALALHLGSQKYQSFFGGIFGASDEVRFPGDRSSIRVGVDNVPDFVRPKSGKGPNFFFGVVIGGTTVTTTTLRE